MADTAQNVIGDALKELGYLGVGETPSADDLTEGLRILNDWAGAKGTQRLMQWATKEESFALQGGVGTYTMGSGGVFNTVRPTGIVQGYIRDTNNNDVPVEFVPEQRFKDIAAKLVSDPYPRWAWYDPQFPLGLVKFWGVPSAAYTVFLSSPLQPGTFALAATAFSMPPEYRRMYIKNLAVEMSPTFGMEPTRLLLAQAADAAADLRRNNAKPVPMKNDAAGLFGGGARSGYSIYRGG